MTDTLENLQRDVTDAHQAVVTVRNLWHALYRAIDVRTAAHVALEQAQEAVRAAAAKLNITTLPLDGAALADMRKDAEAQAHESFKRAREALAKAKAR
jgi:hypothetical protein